MRALPTTFLLTALTAFVGCREEERHAADLEKLAGSASRIVLYSLDPTGGHGYATHNDRIFHGFEIIGRAEITDPAERGALVRALAESVRRPPDMVAACFNPRHGLSIQDGSRTADFTICFECHQMHTHGFARDGGLIISPAQEQTFDASLRRHDLQKSKT